MNLKKYKKDIVLLSVIVLITVLSVVWLMVSKKKELKDAQEYYVVVTLNNKTELVVPYGVDGTYSISNPETGLTNVFIVTTDGVYMSHADCPDQVCVKQGLLKLESLYPIACLPNKMIIQITASIPEDYDGKLY